MSAKPQVFEVYVKCISCLRHNAAQRGRGQLPISCSGLIWAFGDRVEGVLGNPNMGVLGT